MLLSTACRCGAAAPIVFSLYGAADGQLDGQGFSGAEIRLELKTDTAHTMTVIEDGVTVYRNDQGTALLHLTRDGQTEVVHIAPKQLFVRYEPTNGVVSFGASGIGPFYPAAVGWCTIPLGCGTVNTDSAIGSITGALAQLRADPNDIVFYSSPVRAQASELRGPTLLTGFMDACYAFDVANNRCPAIPSVPIKTDHGDLYFQKQSVFGKGIFTAVMGSGP
jgi:hypothetical protein